MRDLFVEIYESIRRNKLRTVLTGFAVAWGIFMLIVLLGAGNGLVNSFGQASGSFASNTIAVYAKKGSRFDFTDRAVKITGKLEIGDYEDEFGYEYNYRIVNAKAQVLELKDLSGDYAIWTRLSQDGVVSEIYSMFDFLHFVCQWSDYYLNMTDENGEVEQVPMWPGDVVNLLNEPAPYGYAAENAAGYFNSLISRVNAVSAEKLSDLTKLLSECEQLKNEALAEIENENYRYNQITDSYRQNNYDALYEKWYDLYARYTVDFMERWEL